MYHSFDTDTTQNQFAGTINFEKRQVKLIDMKSLLQITQVMYTKYVTADGSASYSITVSNFTLNDNSNITISVTINAVSNMTTLVTQSVSEA